MALRKCILGVVVLLSVSVWIVSADLGNGAEASEKPKQVLLNLDPDTHLELKQDLDQDESIDADVDEDLDEGATEDPPEDTHGLREETDESPEETDESPEETDESPEETDGSPEETDESPEETDESPEETDELREETDESPEETDELREETDESPEETDESPEETDGSPEETDESPEETDESPEETDEPPEDKEDGMSVSERLEMVNKNLVGDEDSEIEDGDVMVLKSHVQKRNADRCTRRGCRWRRSKNGKVYVPYVIANHYSSAQLKTIQRAFRTFAKKTCIRFVRHRNPCRRRCGRRCNCRCRRRCHCRRRCRCRSWRCRFRCRRRRWKCRLRCRRRRWKCGWRCRRCRWGRRWGCFRCRRRYKKRDHLYIHSSTGCSSYIGRRGRRQKLSLSKNGCVYLGIIQHELLHALGFHHEHRRSDRNKYVRVLWNNIQRKKRHNFRRTRTRNLGTPYDYGSVMHYRSTAFSKNGRPTLVARRRNVTFGNAKRMSRWDIIRVNRLYCR